MSVFIGFIFGYILSRVVNYVTARGTTVRIVAASQIQALRMLSTSISQFYKLHLWHDKVATSVDDAQRKLKEVMLDDKGVLVQLPNDSQGFVKIGSEDLEEAAENWSSSRVQELKLIWNTIEYSQKEWEEETILMLKLAMGPYGKFCTWNNWKEAMEFLARYELLELEYVKNNNKS